MNKNKKLILISMAAITPFPILAISATSCDNNKKNLIEFNQLVRTFPINIDVNKYTIDQALNINNYEITFDKNGKFEPEFKIDSLKIEGDKVIVSYHFHSKKYNFDSIPLTKTFTNFKKVVNPTPNPDPDPQDQLEVNYQEELDKAAQSLKVTIESEKYTIEEALKLENYKYELQSEKLTFELVSLTKKSDLEVEMQFKLQWKEKNLTSKVITKTFKDFKTLPIAEWTEAAGISNGVSFSKFAKLGNFINVKSSQSLEENLKQITNISNSEVTLTETKIVSYDELEGKIVFETNIKTSTKDFGKQEIELSNIKSSNIFNDEFIVAPEIDKEKLIKAKKQFKEIPSEQAKEYLKLYAYDKENNKIDLFELVKNNQSYSFSRELAITGTEHDTASFALALKYKKMGRNAAQPTEATKTFDKVAIKISNTTYTYVEVLDYIMNNNVVKKENVEIKDTYASSYLHAFRTTGRIIHNFYENKEENYYNDGNSKIQFSNETQTTNDIEGNINISFSLMIEKEGRKYYSKPKEVKIEGFKKISSDTFESFQLQFLTNKTSVDNFIKRVKQEYLKDNNKILDKNWLKTSMQYPEFSIVRTIDEGNVTQKLEVQNHSIFALSAGGRLFSECIDPTVLSQVQIYNNDPKFELNSVFFELEELKFTNFDSESKRVSFELKYKMNISTSSNNTIELEKKVSYFFNI
ncbi:hypothetical protein ACJA25_00340 [Mycoplasmopsis hyopharyngis]|uniref:hypothetical protein n=1 Tax=Mycoplasmopsis hyopharyngis TaxID=29558 RepID=UPI0038733ACE